MKKGLRLIPSIMLCITMILTVCSCFGPSTPQDSVNVPEGTKNAVVVRYIKNDNDTITATISVEGDVEYAAIVGILSYDKNVLTYVSHEAIDCANVNNKEAGVIAFSQANSKNYTDKQTLFKVTFSYTESLNTSISFTFDEGNFTNDQFNDVEYTVIGGEIKLA